MGFPSTIAANLNCKRRTTAAVLCVEPSRLLRGVIAEVCEQLAVPITGVQDVGGALRAVSHARPLAIISAYELPGLSGLSLVSALKCCPHHRAIPIAMITAGAPLIHDLCAYHPDAIIPKGPQLARDINSFFRSVGVGCALPGPSAAQGRLCGSILWADDAAMIHKLLSRMLHVAGADVVVVENGARALQAADQRPFDLILMDIEMPEMGGCEATTRLRDRGVRTPIIALTAHSADRLSPQQISCGFNSVLTKPVDRETLLRACADYLPAAAG